MLPELTTRKQNPAKIKYHGVIKETSPNKTIFQIMSDIKDIILGKKITFNTAPIDMSELTPFQQLVLENQKKIPYGKVTTYKKLAQQINKPNSARPLANVLATNPFPLIIPCHRTVKSDWTLGGYAGSNNGYYKQFLLENEGIEIKDGTIKEKYRYQKNNNILKSN